MVTARVVVLKVPPEPERSKLPLADVAPLMIGAVSVLFVKVAESALNTNVSDDPMSGIVRSEERRVGAEGRSRRSPDHSTKTSWLVVGEIVTAFVNALLDPPNVFAPVDVLNIPYPP